MNAVLYSAGTTEPENMCRMFCTTMNNALCLKKNPHDCAKANEA